MFGLCQVMEAVDIDLDSVHAGRRCAVKILKKSAMKSQKDVEMVDNEVRIDTCRLLQSDTFCVRPN